MKTISTERVALEEIYETPLQSRLDYMPEELAELAATLKSTGQLQNGVGRRGADGRIELFIGCRRLRASKLAGIELFDVKIVEAVEAEVVKANLVENLQREDLKPMEAAMAVQRMLALVNDEGLPVYSQKGIAAELGKDAKVITHWLGMLKAPKALQAQVNAGKVEYEVAGLIGSLPASLHQAALEQIVNRSWGGAMKREEARKHIAENFRRDLRRASFDQADASLVAGAPPCAQCPSWGGNHSEVEGKARVHVCLDPTCFEAKQKAAIAVTKAHAEEQGVTILEGSKAQNLFNYENELHYSAGYVELSKKPDEGHLKDRNAKAVPKWETILKGSGAPVIIAIDKLGTQRRLVELPVALAAAKMKDNPHAEIFRADAGKGASTVDDKKKAQALAKAENKARNAATVEALAALLEAMSCRWDLAQWRSIVSMVQERNVQKDDAELLGKVLRPDLKRIADPWATLKEEMEKLDRVEQLHGLMAMMYIIRDCRFSGVGCDMIEEHLAAPFGFDLELWRGLVTERAKAARKEAGEAEKGKEKASKKGVGKSVVSKSVEPEPEISSQGLAVLEKAGKIDHLCDVAMLKFGLDLAGAGPFLDDMAAGNELKKPSDPECTMADLLALERVLDPDGGKGDVGLARASRGATPAEASEELFDCAKCGRTNFTVKGLKAHKCKSAPDKKKAG